MYSGPQYVASSASQASRRPPPKPVVGKPMISSEQLPARMIRSAQDSALPYFFLIGHSRRRDLSVLPLSHQLLIGREALQGLAGAAAAVGDAVGAGGVPGHPDHLRRVVAVVRGPPVDRGGQEVLDVGLELVEVDGVERGLVVEVGQGVGGGTVAVQLLDPQPVGVPVRQGRLRGLGAADGVAAEGARPLEDVVVLGVLVHDAVAFRVMAIGGTPGALGPVVPVTFCGGAPTVAGAVTRDPRDQSAPGKVTTT